MSFEKVERIVRKGIPMGRDECSILTFVQRSGNLCYAASILSGAGGISAGKRYDVLVDTETGRVAFRASETGVLKTGKQRGRTRCIRIGIPTAAVRKLPGIKAGRYPISIENDMLIIELDKGPK